MFHELNLVSSLLCIAQNVRFEIPYKVFYFETPFLIFQILCLGVLWYFLLCQSITLTELLILSYKYMLVKGCYLEKAC